MYVTQTDKITHKIKHKWGKIGPTYTVPLKPVW